MVNLRFFEFTFDDAPAYNSLIFIGLSEANENESGNSIYYNFTHISFVLGSDTIITTSNNKTIDYFGKIYLNNFFVDGSYLQNLVWSVLEVNVNSLIINNTAALATPFVEISLSQQALPVGKKRNNISSTALTTRIQLFASIMLLFPTHAISAISCTTRARFIR